MALAVREQSRAMRDAARFLRFLRYQARSDAHYHSSRLREAWERCDSRDTERFRDVCESVTGDSVFWCEDCCYPVWEQSWHGSTGEGTEVCDQCLGAYYYCEHCEQYYSESHEHEQGSVCPVPTPRFRFPLADGRSLASDDIIDVETPAGLISDAGIQEIAQYLWRSLNAYSLYTRVRSEIDHEWTNKSGNFTKRVAKLALQAGYKIEPQTLSEIGNLARAHASSGKSYRVAFSRDLNAAADEWYHDSSCWWTDYSESRCALKQEGGLGLRTFDNFDGVSGRAWVLPLEQSGSVLRPVGDPMSADAFIVFNAYGHDGYEMARIVAQLTGFSYRKIEFKCSPMYINNESGFLIAPQQLCERTDDLSFRISLNCGCKND